MGIPSRSSLRQKNCMSIYVKKNLKTEFEQKRFTPPNKMFVEIGKSSARCYQQCLDWNGNRFEVTGLYVDSFAVKTLYTICK